MAFWNAPLDDERHASACAAALGMVRALEDLNASVAESEEAKDGTPLVLKVGVGINTGQCVVGNMGSDLRFDYTVLGDCVNLASRLEGQTKSYGVPIIIGARTSELVSDEFATLPIDLIRVKGKVEPEAIAALVGGRDVLENPAFRRLLPLHSQMLTFIAIAPSMKPKRSPAPRRASPDRSASRSSTRSIAHALPPTAKPAAGRLGRHLYGGDEVSGE